MPVRSLGRILVFALACAACSPLQRPADPIAEKGSSKAAASDAYGKLPLSFIENRGQVPNAEVAHYATTPSGSIGFTSRGVRVGLSDGGGTRQAWSLAMDFVGGRAEPVAEARAEGVVSYFTGDREDWLTGIPTYGRIVYRDLWDGIDLVYRSDGPNLKYEFVVHPGADPDDIRVRWRGATEVVLTADGSLRVATPAGSVSDAPPVSFQDGRTIRTAYALDGETVGFRPDAYDPRRTLVIDPLVMVYAGYIGGSGFDDGYGMGVDASGAAYVTGDTDSTAVTFPEAVGPIPTHSGGRDAFVAKVSPSGTTLVYAGYIGGAGDDYGYDLAVDASGAAYVTGYTNSTPDTFPDAIGPSGVNAGGQDAFVAKVTPSGTGLAYAGYIGGSGGDNGFGIAVDGSGAAYVTGRTTSPPATFPESIGPDLTHGGGNDAFVAKVVPSGAGLAYAGYVGGVDEEQGVGIAVDGSGAAYVAGYTKSTAATFPVTVGPELTHDGGYDAFVAKVAPGGSGFVYAGYIGGSSNDNGYAVAVDASGAAYVTGDTVSSPATFPETIGPMLTPGGAVDGFVAKVAPSGAGLVYAGYIGGLGNDWGFGIAVDAGGAAFVTGETSSEPDTFPETAGPPFTYGGSSDAFVVKVSPGGNGIGYAAYLGGAGDDRGVGIAVDAAGAAYVAGGTTSTPETFPDTIGPPFTYGGGRDAFLAKVTDVCLGRSITLLGTAGSDSITGTPGDDVIFALGGDDRIRGGEGDDTVCAGDGDDWVVGGRGSDTLDGEAGVDTASFAGTIGVVVDLLLGTASGLGADTLANIENLTGSAKRDTLRGSTAANVLRGGGGSDRLSGRGGKDRLVGQKGNDRLAGGGGNDRLAGGKGDDRMNGGKGRKDRCNGGEGDGDIATGACERVTGVP